MFPLDLVLAVALIACPPVDDIDAPEDEEGLFLDAPAEAAPCALNTLQALSLALELMDAREARYLFADPKDYTADLRVIRARYRELADAPLLMDAARFPSQEFCREMVASNRAYARWLADRKRLFPRQAWIDEALLQLEERYRVWDAAADAATDYFYLTVRRERLKLLRELLGPEMYYAGLLPGPVPAWSLRRAD